MNSKFISLILLLINIFSIFSYCQEYIIQSPAENISVLITVSDKVTYSINFEGETIIAPSEINMVINGKTIGADAKVQKVTKRTGSDILRPVVPRKFSEISDHYNEITLNFRTNYALTFRVYDDGLAYRWETNMKNQIKINSELASFCFTNDYRIWSPQEESMFSHQERDYKYLSLSEIDENMFSSTAILIDLGDGKKALISEAELKDYPGLFLKGSSSFGLTGKFAPYPKKTRQTNDRNVMVTEYEEYLAITSGKRNYPWRVIVLTNNDAQLINSEIIYKLSGPLQLTDVSWIKPGKVAWDWWNFNNIYGVDFKAGINTETYKYYIDFASKYNIPYIILDEGWYNLEDILSVTDEIDMDELLRYSKEKNVGIILWTTWKALDDQLDKALDQFEKWGIKGIKVDFMQRDDQWMVNYYYKIAKEAARHKLLVDFHGAYKPTGMHRAYPNVITYEAVKGLENSKWSDQPSPDHNLLTPFIRMVTGPMDYTPGAMLNGTKENFRSIFNQPMSPGTRCHQLAMYVIYESPLQMLADNPSNYYREAECMEFLKEVPVTWEDTKVLHAKTGEYLALARKNAERWYIGAMTNWDSRSLELDMSFLDKGNYEMDIWQDGVNAERYGSDYKKIKLPVSNNSSITIKLASGGGWVAIIRK